MQLTTQLLSAFSSFGGECRFLIDLKQVTVIDANLDRINAAEGERF
jgi:hypothetical protein